MCRGFGLRCHSPRDWATKPGAPLGDSGLVDSNRSGPSFGEELQHQVLVFFLAVVTDSIHGLWSVDVLVGATPESPPWARLRQRRRGLSEPVSYSAGPSCSWYDPPARIANTSDAEERPDKCQLIFLVSARSLLTGPGSLFMWILACRRVLHRDQLADALPGVSVELAAQQGSYYADTSGG